MSEPSLCVRYGKGYTDESPFIIPISQLIRLRLRKEKLFALVMQNRGPAQPDAKERSLFRERER